jgi:hypothetical protein
MYCLESGVAEFPLQFPEDLLSLKKHAEVVCLHLPVPEHSGQIHRYLLLMTSGTLSDLGAPPG